MRIETFSIFGSLIGPLCLVVGVRVYLNSFFVRSLPSSSRSASYRIVVNSIEISKNPKTDCSLWIPLEITSTVDSKGKPDHLLLQPRD